MRPSVLAEPGDAGGIDAPAICRAKKAMSLGVMTRPALPNSGLGLGLTTVGLMPWRRSSALSRLALRADCSPFILTPRLSVPSQTNGTSWLVLRSTGACGFFIAVRVADMLRFSPPAFPTPAISGWYPQIPALTRHPHHASRRSRGDRTGVRGKAPATQDPRP